MSKHLVKVLNTNFVTHNVKRFVVEKPVGFSFVPGQACDVSINRPGLEEELRPFTFTSTTESDTLEFIIKIYSGHNGITKKLGTVGRGDELILHDVFGTIAYQGDGLYIAGGAGITPFIAILRDLKLKNNLEGNTLIFANRTANDVILEHELRTLLADKFISVIEASNDPTIPPKFIDRELLRPYVGEQKQFYYICGPEGFTNMIIEYLSDLGVDKSQIIIEESW
jgi:ferredoxin-NADP reductase